MNTRTNKVIIYKLFLFLLSIILIFISGCSLLGLEPSDEIVEEAVRVCANSCTPPPADWCKMQGEAKIADFKITNSWKKQLIMKLYFSMKLSLK